MDDSTRARLNQFLQDVKCHITLMEHHTSMKKVSEDMRKFRSMASRIESIANDFFEDLQQNYAYCTKCMEYIPYKDFPIVSELKICENILLDSLDLTDAAVYGDAVVEFTYEVCPLCGAKYQANRKIVQAFNIQIKEI